MTEDSLNGPAEAATRRRLIEYDFAWQSVVKRAVNGFVGSHELLGRIRHHQTPHIGPIRNVRTPQVLDQAGETIATAAFLGEQDLRTCSVDAHAAFVAELADGHVSAMAKMFFRSINEVTDAAGTAHDASGEPLTWDTVLDMLEQMPLSFDPDGTPQPPIFVAPPETLAKLAPMSEEQLARHADILRKKGEEHAATKRSRRLPR